MTHERPLSIALVSAHHPPEHVGGVETVVRAQARELVRAGHSVRIVCGTQVPSGGADVVRDVVDGIPVARMPRFVHERVPGGGQNARVEALVQAEVAGADVVHVHHTWTLSSGLVRALSRVQPVVLTLHDHWTTCPRFFRCSPIAGIECPSPESTGDGGTRTCARCVADDAGTGDLIALERALRERNRSLSAEAAAASLLVFPSRAHRDALQHLLPAVEADRSRVAVVPHGVSSDVSAARDRRGHWDGSRPLRVLHAGNRTAVKGTLDLVRALAAMPRGSVELVLAGAEVEPGFDEQLRAEARGLPLEIRPRYDAGDLSELLRDADLAAYPSRAAESYGMVVEEALAAGVPAWVSSSGALAEILQSCGRSDALPGLVLPPGDPAAWTQAFRALQLFPMMLDRQRASIDPRTRSASDAARELEGLYRGLLATIS